jgi:hypothetical protein
MLGSAGEADHPTDERVVATVSTTVVLGKHFVETMTRLLDHARRHVKSQRAKPWSGHRHHQRRLALASGSEIDQSRTDKLVAGKIYGHLVHSSIVGPQGAPPTASPLDPIAQARSALAHAFCNSPDLACGSLGAAAPRISHAEADPADPAFANDARRSPVKSIPRTDHGFCPSLPKSQKARTYRHFTRGERGDSNPRPPGPQQEGSHGSEWMGPGFIGSSVFELSRVGLTLDPKLDPRSHCLRLACACVMLALP